MDHATSVPKEHLLILNWMQGTSNLVPETVLSVLKEKALGSSGLTMMTLDTYLIHTLTVCDYFIACLRGM